MAYIREYPPGTFKLPGTANFPCEAGQTPPYSGRLPFFSHDIHKTRVRDGPLEKLWGGGEGNFRAAGIFFRYQIPCMNFFRP